MKKTLSKNTLHRLQSFLSCATDNYKDEIACLMAKDLFAGVGYNEKFDSFLAKILHNVEKITLVGMQHGYEEHFMDYPSSSKDEIIACECLEYLELVTKHFEEMYRVINLASIEERLEQEEKGLKTREPVYQSEICYLRDESNRQLLLQIFNDNLSLMQWADIDEQDYHDYMEKLSLIREDK